MALISVSSQYKLKISSSSCSSSISEHTLQCQSEGLIKSSCAFSNVTLSYKVVAKSHLILCLLICVLFCNAWLFIVSQNTVMPFKWLEDGNSDIRPFPKLNDRRNLSSPFSTVTLALPLITLRKANCQIWDRLWKGPHGKELMPPAWIQKKKISGQLTSTWESLLWDYSSREPWNGYSSKQQFKCSPRKTGPEILSHSSFWGLIYWSCEMTIFSYFKLLNLGIMCYAETKN